MSCKHGNHPDACDICDEVDAAYEAGVASCEQALSDQEAEIAKWSDRALREQLAHAEADALLREAIEWNWLDDEQPPPDVIERITAHLGATQHD